MVQSFLKMTKRKDEETAEIQESIKRMKFSQEKVILSTKITTKVNYYADNEKLGKLVNQRIKEKLIQNDHVDYTENNAILKELRLK
jgi:hypothetical protein